MKNLLRWRERPDSSLLLIIHQEMMFSLHAYFVFIDISKLDVSASQVAFFFRKETSVTILIHLKLTEICISTNWVHIQAKYRLFIKERWQHIYSDILEDFIYNHPPQPFLAIVFVEIYNCIFVYLPTFQRNRYSKKQFQRKPIFKLTLLNIIIGVYSHSF